jgi:hypothetical protein
MGKKIVISIGVLFVTSLITITYIRGENVMNIKKEEIINKSVLETWDVMGNQFGDVSKWSSVFHDSKVSGKPEIGGLDYSIRITETDKGMTEQKINFYNQKKTSLSYAVTKGTPSFVTSAVYVWTLTKVSKNKTKLNAELTIKTVGIKGVLVGPIMKTKMGRILNNMVEELKYYVEEGKPHPRKIKTQTK